MHSSGPSTSSASRNSRKILVNNRSCGPSTSKTGDCLIKNCSSEPSRQQTTRTQAIKQIYKFFVDSLVSSTVIKFHRDTSLNSMVGLHCQPDTSMTVTEEKQSSQSNDSESAQSSSSSKTLVPIRKQIECECYSCHRVIAAARLAPHLEKCIGLGRNSSRVARKRLAHFAIGKSQSASSSPRLNTRISMSSNNNDTDANFIDEVASEDSEWRDSRTPPSVAAKRRRNNTLSHSNGGSLPPNIQPSRYSSRIRPR